MCLLLHFDTGNTELKPNSKAKETSQFRLLEITRRLIQWSISLKFNSICMSVECLWTLTFFPGGEPPIPDHVIRINGSRDILHGGKTFVEAESCQVTNDDGSVDLTLGTALLMDVYWVHSFQYPKKKERNSFLETCFWNESCKKCTCAGHKTSHRTGFKLILIIDRVFNDCVFMF